VAALASAVEAGPAYTRALAIARLVQEIGEFGDDELAMCQTLLQGFASYLRKRPSPTGALWSQP
jgi:hypothetical protein